MLDYKVLELNHGVSYGSTTLKSLQNDHVPELDLLVREAIQNSSDASLGEAGDSFRVNFRTGFFSPREFNSFMTGLQGVLNSLFPGEREKFLEIRDWKTSGLTGPIRMSEIAEKDDHGNFFKLIFDTGKQQTQSGAGGNWGFGKSVYYRVGIGVVIFYSRIKSETDYESRLIITVVEDETKKNPDGTPATLLWELNNRSVGKAWWGFRDGEDFLPITDEEFIQAVLDVFGLQPFGGSDTGTSIIIPYIDQGRLLGDIVPYEAGVSEDVRGHFRSVWGSDIESYLRLAIQRWYAPKIHNRDLPGICNGKKWLHVSVNNEAVKRKDMLPFFRLVQELYTAALAKVEQKEYASDIDCEIVTPPINVNNVFEGGSTAGYLAIAKPTKEQLGGNGMYLSPYVYCGRFEADGGKNEPLVMYTREPGMVIEYAVSGLWVKGIPWPESEEEFIFGFFVPDTAKELKANPDAKEYAGKTLGEYLRSCEASDHMGWFDSTTMTVIKRIQRRAVVRMTEQQQIAEERQIEATASRLSGKLGKILMPRVGYAKKAPGTGGTGGGEGGGGSSKTLIFEVINQTIEGSELQIGFTLRLSRGKRNARITVVVESESGRIDPGGWQKDIGTPFPAAITSLTVLTLKSRELGTEEALEWTCTEQTPQQGSEKISVSIDKAEGSRHYTSFSLESNVIAPEISGKVRIRAFDKRYSFSFKTE